MIGGGGKRKDKKEQKDGAKTTSSMEAEEENGYEPPWTEGQRDEGQRGQRRWDHPHH